MCIRVCNNNNHYNVNAIIKLFANHTWHIIIFFFIIIESVDSTFASLAYSFYT